VLVWITIEKQHSSTRNSYVPGVNSVQGFSIVHYQIMISPESDVTSAYKIELDEIFCETSGQMQFQ